MNLKIYKMNKIKIFTIAFAIGLLILGFNLTGDWYFIGLACCFGGGYLLGGLIVDGYWE